MVIFFACDRSTNQPLVTFVTPLFSFSPFPLFPREDLACRLPELEQPGSDQDNLDSEASLSSESLLGERCNNSEPEGQY